MTEIRAEEGDGPFRRVAFISREHRAITRMFKKEGSIQLLNSGAVTEATLESPLPSADTEGKDWP